LRYILILFIVFIYIGCGIDSSKDDYRFFLYRLFKTEYFWKDKVQRDSSYYLYSNPQEMIDGLKYKAKDRWSMVLTKSQNNNFLNQKATGFGFSYTLENNNSTIVFVRIDSPANKAGIKRGDLLLKVDNKNITYQNILEATKNLDSNSQFLIYRPSIDKNITINITSQEYTFKVTSSSIVLSDIGQEVGYLRLDSFTAEATEEIESAFDFFKSKNIQNLIIDMRYNSGGSIITASILLDKLLRDRDEEIQFSLRWNSDFQNKNEVGRFETDNNSLDLDKIIFLTSRATASASELVINALKPYKGSDIVLVGDRTYGKPVGMEGKTDGKYIFYLVNFVISNADGFYNYFNGLDVTNGCSAVDDLTHQLGDREESMLKKALFYIDNGRC